MKYKTTEELVKKQQAYWDADFALEGDVISSIPEEVAVTDLILPDDEVLKIYETEEKDQEIIQKLAEAMTSGVSLPPLLVDKSNNVIDGYHRLLAAKKIGMATVLVIRLNKNNF